MSDPIPGPPRQDLTITWGADLDVIVTCEDDTGAPWPFAANAVPHIRIGADRKSALIDCEWHPAEQSAILVHVDHAVLDSIKRSAEYQVLTSTPVAGADPILNEPWIVGLLTREVLK